MQRRHFAAVARALDAARMFVPPLAYAELVERMAVELASTNPRFSRERFRRACGLDGMGLAFAHASATPRKDAAA